MNAKEVDYSVVLVTDRGMAGARSLVDIVAAAVDGGVTCVQLREKSCSTREFLDLAMELKSLLSATNVALIINDRLDVALAADADGVHLGQSDMPCQLARRLMGHSKIIGISAESMENALRAKRDGADYLGVSPVFDTPTKTDTAPALGFEGLSAMRKAVDLPLVGIGGVNASNAAEVIQNGANGVAVVSAIMAAADPEQAARDLVEMVKRNS